MKGIGERIRALRTDQGMTLAELGEKTSLSASYLSQIERDKTTPSLSTLTGVAKALNVGLRHFFETETEAAFVVRNAGRNSDSSSYSSVPRVSLARHSENNRLEVYHVVLSPHSPPEPLARHSGEEFAIVIAGQLTVDVEDEQFVLVAGDSIHYDAIQPHRWANPGDEPCVVIWSHSASWSERQP